MIHGMETTRTKTTAAILVSIVPWYILAVIVLLAWPQLLGWLHDTYFSVLQELRQ
jgi:hypothetical protein